MKYIFCCFEKVFFYLIRYECFCWKKIILQSKKLNRLSGSEAIGKSVTHLSAPLQVQGKAEFTDDIPLDLQAKHAAFVTSTIALWYIKRINYKTEELKKKDFIIITADDLIKEANHVGPNKNRLLYRFSFFI
ncbi:hypothetical protein M9Y10_019469 [Tritrichomonas musculus]|uniref:Aldehyde oxidase/xanthine dehydrogenase a/b hammerhead domain-containing protein n=1 Tax=Tritrichomonas musculus TaxID=1915356 RepID=A0ABR2HHG6_9EUKA